MIGFSLDHAAKLTSTPGPVSKARIQRVARAMLQFGFMGQQYAPQVEQGTLVATMVGPAS